MSYVKKENETTEGRKDNKNIARITAIISCFVNVITFLFKVFNKDLGIIGDFIVSNMLFINIILTISIMIFIISIVLLIRKFYKNKKLTKKLIITVITTSFLTIIILITIFILLPEKTINDGHGTITTSSADSSDKEVSDDSLSSSQIANSSTNSNDGNLDGEINKTKRGGNYEVTVLSITSNNGSLNYTPAKGNKYIFIKIAIKNISNNDVVISSDNFDAIANGEKQYYFYDALNALKALNELKYNQIKIWDILSEQTLEGYYAWEVPETAQKLHFLFYYNPYHPVDNPDKSINQYADTERIIFDILIPK